MSSDPSLTVVPHQPPGKVTPPGAVWSLVLGILSLFCLWLLGSIPAIILGALSIKKAKANPETVGGEGLALAGIITGAIGVFTGLFTVGMVAAIAMPSFSAVKERAEETKAMLVVRQATLATVLYATNHPESKFPNSLDELIPEYLADDSSLNYTLQDGTVVTLKYRKGVSRTDTNEPIIMLRLPTNSNPILGFPDGSVTRPIEPIEASVLAEFE